MHLRFGKPSLPLHLDTEVIQCVDQMRIVCRPVFSIDVQGLVERIFCFLVFVLHNKRVGQVVQGKGHVKKVLVSGLGTIDAESFAKMCFTLGKRIAFTHCGAEI